MSRIKFDYSCVTFRWYARKKPAPCVDCGTPAFNHVEVLEDFTSVGSMRFCDPCKTKFREEFPPRSTLGQKHKFFHKRKEVRNNFPSHYPNITKRPYKFTKPEAIKLRHQAMALHNEYKLKKGKLDNSSCFTVTNFANTMTYKARLSQIQPILEQAEELDRQACLAEGVDNEA